jgi:hypothetical protein
MVCSLTCQLATCTSLLCFRLHRVGLNFGTSIQFPSLKPLAFLISFRIHFGPTAKLQSVVRAPEDPAFRHAMSSPSLPYPTEVPSSDSADVSADNGLSPTTASVNVIAEAETGLSPITTDTESVEIPTEIYSESSEASSKECIPVIVAETTAEASPRQSPIPVPAPPTNAEPSEKARHPRPQPLNKHLTEPVPVPAAKPHPPSTLPVPPAKPHTMPLPMLPVKPPVLANTLPVTPAKPRAAMLPVVIVSRDWPVHLPLPPGCLPAPPSRPELRNPKRVRVASPPTDDRFNL